MFHTPGENKYLFFVYKNSLDIEISMFNSTVKKCNWNYFARLKINNNIFENTCLNKRKYVFHLIHDILLSLRISLRFHKKKSYWNTNHSLLKLKYLKLKKKKFQSVCRNFYFLIFNFNSLFSLFLFNSISFKIFEYHLFSKFSDAMSYVNVE